MAHTETIQTACNNTFQPTKFGLTYDIESTITSPLAGANAAPIYPGDSFDVSVKATANVSATFLNGAFALIGPQQITILKDQITLGPKDNMTGSNITITDNTDIVLPQPGDVRTVGFTSGSTHITGAFAPADVGANVYDSTTGFTAGATIASVAGDGLSAELSLAATDTGPTSVRIWHFLTTDIPLVIGTGTGTYVADGATTAPFQASFQILGNSSTTGDQVGGVFPGYKSLGASGVGPNTAYGFTSLVDASAHQTEIQASLGPGINPSLVCMGGTWTETTTGAPPVTSSGLPYIQPVGFGLVDVTPLPIPTATVAGVTGIGGAPAQFVTSAARSGNTLHFGGGNWTPSAVVDSVELCNAAGTACDAAGLSGVTTSVDSSGVLTGAATVTSTATTGAGRHLKVTAGSEVDNRATLQILGTPTLTLGSGSGPAGGTVSFTGSDWNPLTGGVSGTTFALPVTLAGSPLGAPTPVVVNATGGLSGSIVTPTGTEAVSVFDANPAYPQPPGPATPGSIFGFGLFSINQNAQSCGSGSPLVGCTLDQSLYLNVEPGDFTWSQDTPFIVLNAAGHTCAEPNQTTCYGMTLDGTTQAVSGSINEITIIDARGAGAPWDVSATMTNLVTGAAGPNEVLPASTMHLSPECTVIDGAAPGGTAAVTTGAAGVLNTATPLPLCSAAAGHAGGTFTVNGDLSMDVPASTFAGLYTGTITFTAV